MRGLADKGTEAHRPLPARYMLALPPPAGLFGQQHTQLGPYEELYSELADLSGLDLDNLINAAHSYLSSTTEALPTELHVSSML